MKVVFVYIFLWIYFIIYIISLPVPNDELIIILRTVGYRTGNGKQYFFVIFYFKNNRLIISNLLIQRSFFKQKINFNSSGNEITFPKKRFIGIYCSAILDILPSEYRYIWTLVLFFQPNRNSFVQNCYFFVTTYESLKYSCAAYKWNQWLFQVCIHMFSRTIFSFLNFKRSRKTFEVSFWYHTHTVMWVPSST